MDEHTIKISISDEEKESLFHLLGRHGLTVEELFKNVISDLVGQGNGSDERDLMDQWFNRCWFSFEPEETLLKYCLEWGYDIDDVVTAWEENEYYKKFPEEFEDEGDGERWFETDLHDIDEYMEKHPDKDMSEQIDICKKWLEEKEKFFRY